MRFLIVKTSSLGDIIQASGVLDYLHARLPDCQIDWVVEKRTEGLVKGHPFVSKAIVIDTSSWRSKMWNLSTLKEMKLAFWELRETSYDAVFDLQSNVKSAVITACSRARDKVGFGYKTAHESVSSLVLTHRYNPPRELDIRQDYLFVVQSYCNDFSQPNTHALLCCNEPVDHIAGSWMVCSGSNWKNKRLTREQLIAFLTLCEMAYGPKFVYLCGSKEEELLAQELQKRFSGSSLLVRPSLAYLQHVMSKMQLVISMDSLPLHLAATTGCPSFSFFGPSNAQKFAPNGALHGSFQGTCPYNRRFEKRCPILRSCPTGACLRDQDPDKLFSEFSNFIKKIPGYELHRSNCQ